MPKISKRAEQEELEKVRSRRGALKKLIAALVIYANNNGGKQLVLAATTHTKQREEKGGGKRGGGTMAPVIGWSLMAGVVVGGWLSLATEERRENGRDSIGEMREKGFTGYPKLAQLAPPNRRNV